MTAHTCRSMHTRSRSAEEALLSLCMHAPASAPPHLNTPSHHIFTRTLLQLSSRNINMHCYTQMHILISTASWPL